MEKKPVIALSLACIGAAAAFMWLAVAVTNGSIQAVDEAALRLVNGWAGPGLDAFFVTATTLGGVYVVAPVTALLVTWVIYKERLRDAIFVLAAIGGAALTNSLLKLVIVRSRPDLWDPLVQELTFSFPSGHAAASMAVAAACVFLAWRTPRRVLVVAVSALYVVLVGLSRMYLGVHYPTDILAGWLLGGVWVAIIFAVVYSSGLFLEKKKTRE